MTSSGVIFATTGQGYQVLARRAARSLKRVAPDLAIDLFTDDPPDDPVFDRIHRLERVSIRPKIEALRRSRFDRTVYLDADIIAVAPIDGLFEAMDRFDIGLCAEQRRSDRRNTVQYSDMPPVPDTFPQMNSGVIALKTSDRTRAMLIDWEHAVHEGRQRFDQISLRAILFHGDLRVLTLPPEYNVMFFAPFQSTRKGFAAPRILHLPRLNKRSDQGEPTAPLDASEILGAARLEGLAEHLATDQTLPFYVLSTDGARQTPAKARRRLIDRIRNIMRRPI